MDFETSATLRTYYRRRYFAELGHYIRIISNKYLLEIVIGINIAL